VLGIGGTTWQWRVASRANMRIGAQVEIVKNALTAVLVEHLNHSETPEFPLIPGSPPYRLTPELKPAAGQPEFVSVGVTKRLETSDAKPVAVQGDDLLPALADLSLALAKRSLAVQDDLERQADAAEWSAYAAYVSLAQAALAANDYSEARRLLSQAPELNRGWEWSFIGRCSLQNRWAVPTKGSSVFISQDGTRIVVGNGTFDFEEHDVQLGTTLKVQNVSWMPRKLAEMMPNGELSVLNFEVPQTNRAARWLMRTLTGASGWISASISEDGQFIAWVGRKDEEPDGANMLRLMNVSQWGDSIRGLPRRAAADRPVDVALDVAVILESSPRPPVSGLEITTPEGLRRIVAGEDRTIRFLETKSNREAAVFRMPETITNLQIAGDGSRLVISLADGTAQVWDIRDPEDRKQDLVREWAERGPAGAYVDELIAGPILTAVLPDAIVMDASLTALRRLVAVQVLDERLEDLNLAAERAFAKLAAGQTDKGTLQAAAEAAELPPRVKAIVLERAAAWEYSPPEPTAEEKLADAEKKRRLAEADAAVFEAQADGPYPDGMAERLKRAVADRRELLGKRHVLTVTAEGQLAQCLGDVAGAWQAEAEVAFREDRYQFALHCGYEAKEKHGPAPSPRTEAIVAMTHWQLGLGTDAALAAAEEDDLRSMKRTFSREEHRQGAREALARARAIMADPANAETWAKNEDAKALLAEAEALINPPPALPK